MRRVAWVIAILLLIADVALAQAPPTEAGSEKAQAGALFQRGIQAYKKRRYKDAIDLFLEANRLYPSPILSFNTARAYDDMGDDAGALRFYRAYLRQKPDASDRKDVSERIGELELALRKRGRQQVTVLSQPEGATVIIDGRPLGVTPWTGELVPGRHRLKLRLEGHQDGQQQFELVSHRAMDVSVKLEPSVADEPRAAPEPAAPAPAPAPIVREMPKDEPKVERDPGLSRVRPWTWGAFGVGVAAFAGAGVFEVLRADAADDVRAERTQLGRIEAYDRMESRQTTARVLAVVGAVGMLAGGTLLYLDLSADAETGSIGVRGGF